MFISRYRGVSSRAGSEVSVADIKPLASATCSMIYSRVFHVKFDNYKYIYFCEIILYFCLTIYSIYSIILLFYHSIYSIYSIILLFYYSIILSSVDEIGRLFLDRNQSIYKTAIWIRVTVEFQPRFIRYEITARGLSDTSFNSD